MARCTVSPQTLSVCLLGEFRISQDETPLTAALTPRLQAVLAYLLLHGDAIPSRQQLAFTLWPDSGDAQARTNLRKAFHRLRHACPVLDVYLDFDGATITRRPRAQIWTDVAHFEAQLQREEFKAMPVSRVADEMKLVREPGPSFIRVRDLPRGNFKWLCMEGGAYAIARCAIRKNGLIVAFLGVDFDRDDTPTDEQLQMICETASRMASKIWSGSAFVPIR